MTGKIIRLSLAFNAPAIRSKVGGVLASRGLGWGRGGCYNFSFIEEKIEESGVGFDMWAKRSTCNPAGQMVTVIAGLSPSAGQSVLLQLASQPLNPPFPSLAELNVELGSEDSNNDH